MVDLETFGTKPGSVICSIGAVKFNTGKGIYEEFYKRIDIESCVKAGLTFDSTAILWWMDQSDDARKELLNTDRLLLSEALSGFSYWCLYNEHGKRAESDIVIWGNGALMDNNLLSVAYDKCALSKPWTYKGDRCYRTVKELYPDIKIESSGILHHALNDAKSQANHLLKMIHI